MKQWPHEVTSYSPEEVQHFCVNDSYWQTIRIGMKGMPTEQKLDILDSYRYNREMEFKGLTRRVEVQCSNYINALKRGGQLDMECKVQR